MQSLDVRPVRLSLVAGSPPDPEPHALPLRVTATPAEADLAYVAFRCGMKDDPVRSVVAYVRHLVERFGFPPPKNARRWAGSYRHGADAVCKRSRWDRFAVDTFFDGRVPPAAALAREEAQVAGVRQRMHAAALQLVA